MTETTCPLCGSSNYKYVFSERNYDLLECGRCGLFFISPYPDTTVVHNSVEDYSYDNLKIENVNQHYRASTLFFDTYFERIYQECRFATSVLDVGCGTGRLLELLERHNPDQTRIGIELNKERAEFARSKVHCDIYQVPIERFEYSLKFDVITMMNVLSHISDFDELFASLRQIMAVDGKLILKVGELPSNAKKGAVYDWEIPDHIHFLGHHTIEHICQKYDFELVSHKRVSLSSEMFSQERWLAPGRSYFRNSLKRLVLSIPFTLKTLRHLYEMWYGDDYYSSVIVLRKK